MPLKVDNINSKGEVKVSNDIKIINQNETKKEDKTKIFKIEKVKDKIKINVLNDEDNKSLENKENEKLHPYNEENNINNNSHNMSLEEIM